MRNTLATVMFGLCLVSSACSEAAHGDESAVGASATSTTTTVAARPAASQRDALLATVEGTWQCDVQRFAFDDLAEQDAMLGERLSAADVTREAYTTFKAALAEDADLRTLVMDAYVDACPGATSGIDGQDAGNDAP